MRFFITRLIIFFLLPIFVIGVIELRIEDLPNSYTVKQSCIEENNNRVKVVNLGSSQAQYGIKIDELDTNGCNLANSSQDLYYDQQLYKKYSNSLPNLKTVIIPVSYFSFEFRLDRTDEYWRKHFYSRYLDIKYPGKKFDIKDHSGIALYTPETALKFIWNGFKVDLLGGNMSNGWFKSNEFVSEAKGSARVSLHEKQMYTDLKAQNTEYLNSIISDAKAKNIEVIILILPVDKSYSNSVSKERYETMLEVLNKISTEQNVKYYNYFYDSRFDLSDFADGSDHLNTKGSQKMAEIIKKEGVINLR